MILPYVPDGCLEQFSVGVLRLAVTEIGLKGLYFHFSVYLLGCTFLISGLGTNLWFMKIYIFEGAYAEEQ